MPEQHPKQTLEELAAGLIIAVTDKKITPQQLEYIAHNTICEDKDLKSLIAEVVALELFFLSIYLRAKFHMIKPVIEGLLNVVHTEVLLHYFAQIEISQLFEFISERYANYYSLYTPGEENHEDLIIAFMHNMHTHPWDVPRKNIKAINKTIEESIKFWTGTVLEISIATPFNTDELERKNINYHLALIYHLKSKLNCDFYPRVQKHYTIAASLGHVQAQYNLGKMYYTGTGVKTDYGQAAQWFGKAAEAGNQQAQYYLAGMYQWGQGVEKDENKARYWFDLSQQDKNQTS